MDSNATAVIVGMELNGLGILRSLGGAGVQTLAVDTSFNKPGMLSRFGKKKLIRGLHGEPLVDALLDISKQFSEPAILFLTKEQSVVTVSRLRHALQPTYRFLLPDHSTLMTLLSKSGFQRIAETCGAKIPRAIYATTSAELRQASELTWPCVLKPDTKSEQYGKKHPKCYIANSLIEAERLFCNLRELCPGVLVQEMIYGDDSSIYFCLQYRGESGELIRSFTGRKIRSWPPRIGGTASCVAAPEAEAKLTAVTNRFYSRIYCPGLVSMEYKWDEKSSEFVMIEPTIGRTDHQAEVATLNGVNIPLAAFRYLIGKTEKEMPSSNGLQIWRDPLSDRWSAMSQRSESKGVSSISNGRLWDAYFRMSDPMPWCGFMTNRVTTRFSRLIKNVWRRSSKRLS